VPSPPVSLPKLDEPKVDENALHPFIDINNKQPDFFPDYRKTVPKDYDEFKLVLSVIVKIFLK
jgi:hypothetical protein